MKKKYIPRKAMPVRHPNEVLLLDSIGEFAENVSKQPIQQQELKNRVERLCGSVHRAKRDTNAKLTYTKRLYRAVKNELDIYTTVMKVCGMMQYLAVGNCASMMLNGGDAKIVLDKLPGGGMISLTIGGDTDDIEDNLSRTIVAGYSESMWTELMWPESMRSIARGVLAYGNLKRP